MPCVSIALALLTACATPVYYVSQAYIWYLRMEMCDRAAAMKHAESCLRCALRLLL